MKKLINEFIIGVRGFKGIMEDYKTKDYRPWIALVSSFRTGNGKLPD